MYIIHKFSTEERTGILKIIKVQHFQIMFLNITQEIGDPAQEPRGGQKIIFSIPGPKLSGNKAQQYHGDK